MGKPARGGWKASLAKILADNNGAKQDGSTASYATRDKRSDVLFAGFEELRAQGYRMDTVTSFRETHLQALVNTWEARGLSASTIQNNISIFRTFASWIGKAGMIEKAEKYVSPGAASRSSIAQSDKSWSGQGVDIAGKIDAVRQLDDRVAIQLELAAAFGLRSREAMQLRPHIADHGSYLTVNLGTKGGRDRVVPIQNDAQREVLERVKTFCPNKADSSIPREYSLSQWKNHYYHVLRKCDITRENGFTAHGLRHEYANNRYPELAGTASPVRGGEQIKRSADYAARLVIAEELGHSREDVTTHYLGRQD